jgi:uncharacterized protein
MVEALDIDPALVARDTLPVSEWIYFLHPPRENFAATMTDDEQAVFAEHFARLQRLLAEGTLVMAGPTLGPTNTGIAVIEATDEATAHARRPGGGQGRRTRRAASVPRLLAARPRLTADCPPDVLWQTSWSRPCCRPTRRFGPSIDRLRQICAHAD